MTDEFTHDELVHERLMQDEGAERYRSLVLEARSKDALTRLPTGRVLVRSALEKVEEYIRDYRRRAKGNQIAAKYVRMVDPPVAAFLALSVVVDGLHRPRKVASLGAAIGRAIEDEYRFRQLKRNDPGLWKKTLQHTARAGPVHKRRVAVHRGRRAGAIPEHWPNTMKARAGLVLLECVIQATDLLEIINVREGPRRTQNYAYPARGAVEWLEEADERAARLSPLYLPTLDVPAAWEGVTGGGYLTDLVLNRPVARFRGRSHRRWVETTPVEQYADTLTALNRLQSVPWRVHEPTLVALEHLLEVGGGPLEHLADQPLPPKPANIAEDEEARTTWRRAAGRARDGNFRRRSSRIMAHRTIGVGRRMHDLGRPFYYPHGLDFRGRAYPRPVWLHPQGPDLARSMLRFGEPEPLTMDGWRALLEYGEKLWGDGEYLDLDRIRRVYQDPLEDAWWTDAEAPCQFLSWCLEVGAAIEAGFPRKPFLSAYPVYQDASNNGLQLYALLTGDRDLARLTNCLPGPKQDLYTAVATAAWAAVQDMAIDGITEARDWVQLLGEKGIPRSAAKRPVMTKSYDVTLWSAADYVLEWYWDQYDPSRVHGGPLEHPGAACRFLASILLGRVDSLCKGAAQGMGWLKGAAHACAKKGLPFRWTAANGWPVMQEYRRASSSVVKTILGGVSRKVSLMQSSGPADLRKQVQGAAPNYVHSVDQAVMSRGVSRFLHAIAAVHDAFGSHPNHKSELGIVLRAAVASTILERDLLVETKRELERYIGSELPDPPRLGVIQPEEVMAAEHLFG